MSYYLQGGGITKLSELNIDGDKDWLVFGISNLKELAAGMTVGDMVVRGGAGILARLSPGTIGYMLTSNGAGAVPTYQAPP